MMTTRDPCVQHVTRLHLQSEIQAKRKKFRPLSMTQRIFTGAPEAPRKTLAKMARNEIHHQDAEFRCSHAATLIIQGKFLSRSCNESALAWSKAVQSSSSQLLKFAINAAQDTLPHNANLALWKKGSMVSDKCRLCGERQTLAHILNCCQVALSHRRYNERHDDVLRVIVGYLKEELSEDYTVVADLGIELSYLFPPQLAISDLRPDITIFSQLQKEAMLIELTVCTEVSYEAAQHRKTAKYLELASEVEANGFNSKLITLEVGSRGLVCTKGFQRLCETISGGKRRWRQLLQDVSSAAIRGSYGIWTSRNHPPD